MITDYHRATVNPRILAAAEEAEVMNGHDLYQSGGHGDWVCRVSTCGASLDAGYALGERCPSLGASS